jgi:hypothetical protein
MRLHAANWHCIPHEVDEDGEAVALVVVVKVGRDVIVLDAELLPAFSIASLMPSPIFSTTDS